MHSDTMIPLAQFAEWLNLDLWKLNGIDKDGSTNLGSTNSQGVVVSSQDPDSCECFFQHPYDSKEHWSRDELIGALKDAEDFFVEESNLHPVPHLIEDEKHGSKNRMGFLPSKNGYKTIMPCYRCGEVTFGTKSLSSLGVYTIIRENPDPQILDSFIIVFPMDVDYDIDDVRIYFTQDDFAGRKTTFDYNCHIAEIRPFGEISSEVDPNDATMQIVTIVAPAYLFKKPSLDELTRCLAHELATYVDEIEVFIALQDSCSYGQVECPAPCSGDCNKNQYSICLRSKLVGKKEYAEILFKSCSEVNGVVTYSSYALECVPKELHINYISGSPLDDCKRAERKVVDTISKLALALHDCDNEFCKCSSCATSKLKYYREIPKFNTVQSENRNVLEDEYQPMVDKIATRLVDGLTPTNGMIQAMRQISRWHRCDKVEASYR